MEIDLPHSPPPVEDMLAARRAKREAIRLKHLGINSVNTSVSPSPGPSSAAQPLPTRLHVSNPVSQNFHTEQASEQLTGSDGDLAQSGEYVLLVRSVVLIVVF